MTDFPTRSIAAELKAWRVKLGVSQAGGAELLRVPVRTLQGWEAGKPCSLAGAILALTELVAERAD